VSTSHHVEQYYLPRLGVFIPESRYKPTAEAPSTEETETGSGLSQPCSPHHKFAVIRCGEAMEWHLRRACLGDEKLEVSRLGIR
jgi:hypothetical protein